ncbi:MAG TPA: AAA family ATPase [Egibacteraceae bacterium]|nr:AAA family ATPase [Egibacteraceae bacterium]
MAFIGRERELAVLGSALQRASQGELTRVALAGPLGIGTSRLIDELEMRLAGAPGVILCRARCYAPQAGIAYASIRSALYESLLHVPDDELANILGSAAYDLATLMPALAERLSALGIPGEPPALEAPDQRGARVREGLLAVLERLARRGQLCLVIEDLEHADPGTYELVQMLLRLHRRVPLTLIVAYHPEELGRGHQARGVAREIEESAQVEQLVLEPLAREELLGLVESLEGERPTLGFLAAVMEGSRGNPLVAGQLVVAHRRLAGMRLSDPLEEIVHARLGQLERQPARLLRLVAAARRPLHTDLIANVRLGAGRVQRAVLATILETDLVAEVGDSGEIGIHQLIAEAIDHSALPAERHELHAALAELLAHEPAESAWHWSRAMRPGEARADYVAAAQRSEQIEPGPTTLLNYNAALELHTKGRDDPEMLAGAARAADASGAFRRAVTLTEQAVEQVAGGHIERLMSPRSDAADRSRAALLSADLGRYRRSSGDLNGAREAIEQAVKLAPADASEVRAVVLAALAQDLMLEGRFVDSAALAEEARSAAAAAGDAALAELAHSTDTLAVDLGFAGKIDRGLELLDEALAAARRAGRLDEVMRCYANKTTLLDLDSRREAALAVVKEGIAEARRGGLGLTYGAFLRGNAADILFRLGRWEESEAECRAALEFPPAGVAWFSPILYLGLVLVESRADEEAAGLVGRTLLQLETVPAGQWSALVLRMAVSLALWRGETKDALSAAEQGWERVLETDDPAQVASSAATVLEACAAAAERGRSRRDWSAVAEAGALAGRALPAAQEQLRNYRLPETVGARREAGLYLATARAHADRVRGRARPETWDQLAASWAAVPVPYNVAKARWWQAQAALASRARRNEARRALTEAWRIAGRLPAAPLRRALRELADRGRIKLPEEEMIAIPIEPERVPVAVGPGQPGSERVDLSARVGGAPAVPTASRFGLSPRENSVLLVLAEGRTNREIAERLFISERTVAVHVRRILAKLRVSGRVEAAGLAIRLGLVPDDPRVGTGIRPPLA